MSKQPGPTTAGIPTRPVAFIRSGPAVRTPPTNSSASSVVVRSSTPATIPESMIVSIDLPPAPVAAKTNTSYPFSSSIRFASLTHAVVFPNIDATINGLSDATSILTSTIPQIAPAARVKIIFESRFNPATSVTLGIKVISLVPI